VFGFFCLSVLCVFLYHSLFILELFLCTFFLVVVRLVVSASAMTDGDICLTGNGKDIQNARRRQEDWQYSSFNSCYTCYLWLSGGKFGKYSKFSRPVLVILESIHSFGSNDVKLVVKVRQDASEGRSPPPIYGLRRSSTTKILQGLF